MSAELSTVVDAVDVYWRPGCGYCDRLLKALHRAGVVVRLHNIWQDEQARQFVRTHNRGNETVPTVVLGDEVATNPTGAKLLDRIGRDYPHLLQTQQ